MKKEPFESLCMYGLSFEFPRSWRLIIESKQVSFDEGKINTLGTDILAGLLWEKVDKVEISLEDYDEMVLTNLQKKDKKFKLINKETTEVCGHQAFLEIMETRGRSGFIGLKKGIIEHVHLLFFCNVSKRFVTLYVTVVPELKREYSDVIDRIFSSVKCYHHEEGT